MPKRHGWVLQVLGRGLLLIRMSQVRVPLGEAAVLPSGTAPGCHRDRGRPCLRTICGARRALADLDGLAHGSLLIGASTTPRLYVLPRISSKVSRSDWRATPGQSPRALLCKTRP